jgi:hypothetical protein
MLRTPAIIFLSVLLLAGILECIREPHTRQLAVYALLVMDMVSIVILFNFKRNRLGGRTK